MMDHPLMEHLLDHLTPPIQQLPQRPRLGYARGVSVCLPTWRRAKDLPRRLHLLAQAIPDCQVEFIVVCDDDDPDSRAAVREFSYIAYRRRMFRVRWRRLEVRAGTFPTTKWNLAALYATQEWLLMATDDVEWSSTWWPGYDRLPAKGYLGLHDQLSRRCGSHTLWLARRDWLIRYAGGTLVCPLVRHVFADVIMTLLAVRAGTNVVASGLIGEHVHRFTEAREDIAIDESRRRAHAWRDDGQDQAVFDDLKRRGFPVGLAASPKWRSLWHTS